MSTGSGLSVSGERPSVLRRARQRRHPQAERGLAVVCRRSVRLLDRALGLGVHRHSNRRQRRAPLNDAAPTLRPALGSARCAPMVAVAWLALLPRSGGSADGGHQRPLDRQRLGLDYSATTMYFIDTPSARVDAYEYEVRSGTSANGHLRGYRPGDGKPDGLTVDADGCLWVALWNGVRSARTRPPDSYWARSGCL